MILCEFCDLVNFVILVILVNFGEFCDFSEYCDLVEFCDFSDFSDLIHLAAILGTKTKITLPLQIEKTKPSALVIAQCFCQLRELTGLILDKLNSFGKPGMATEWSSWEVEWSSGVVG